jgi:hypothetical protein
MPDDYISQDFTPRRLQKFLDDNRFTQSGFCALTDEAPSGGISGSSLSQFLSGLRPALTLKAQVTIHRVMDFAKHESELAGGLPLDFNAPEMRKLFRAWLRSRTKGEAIKTAAEESAEAAKA